MGSHKQEFPPWPLGNRKNLGRRSAQPHRCSVLTLKSRLRFSRRRRAIVSRSIRVATRALPIMALTVARVSILPCSLISPNPRYDLTMSRNSHYHWRCQCTRNPGCFYSTSAAEPHCDLLQRRRGTPQSHAGTVHASWGSRNQRVPSSLHGRIRF